MVYEPRPKAFFYANNIISKKSVKTLIINHKIYMRKAILAVIIALTALEPSVMQAAGINYRYTGQELDQTGLYDYGRRQYQPNVGQFIQPDPVGLNLSDPQKLRQQTGQSQQQILANPQNLNSYSYTANNPVNYIDPEGEFNYKTGEVEQGDTLSKVFGDQWRAVAEYNNIKNPNLIYAGQILKLPDSVKKNQSLLQEGLDWGTSLTPGASDLRDVKELVYGADAFSGEKIGIIERVELVGLAILPLVSRSLIKKARRMTEKLADTLNSKLLENKTVKKVLKITGLNPEQVRNKINLPKQLDNWTRQIENWLGGVFGKN